MKIRISISSKITSIDFLKFTFWVSLLGILTSILLSYIFNSIIYFYYVSYLLISLIALSSLNPLNRKNFSGVSRNVFYLIFYSLTLTLFLTAIYGNLIAFIVFYKDFLLPIILFLYYVIRLTDFQKVDDFISTLVKGGIFSSIYILFEFLNKYFNIFPFINKAIFHYASESKHNELAYFFDPTKFRTLGVIRPMGLDINPTAAGFFMASIFLIVFISGYRYFKSRGTQIFILIILYFGTIASTSRQNIFALHILLFIISYVFLFYNKLLSKELNRALKRNLQFILIILSALILGYFVNSTRSGNSKFVIEALTQTGSILSDNLKKLPNDFLAYFHDHPFNVLFGIGAYTPGHPGIYQSLPPINELHFLLDIPYILGLIGAFLYWSIFIISISTCWRAFKIAGIVNDNYQDFYLIGFSFGVLFCFNIVHYAPNGLSSNFIIGMIPLLAIFSRRFINIQKAILQ